MTPFHLRAACRALHAGELLAYPTEAVWGLGCQPLDAAAVARLLNLKQRPIEKGLILIADRFELLAPYLKPLTPDIEARVFPTWPGPVTWVLPAAEWVPDWLTGARESLAVRVTAHTPVAALCRAYGGALVSTSANPAGRVAARSALAVRRYFGDRVTYLSAATGGRDRPSQIRDGQTGRELRPA